MRSLLLPFPLALALLSTAVLADNNSTAAANSCVLGTYCKVGDRIRPIMCPKDTLVCPDKTKPYEKPNQPRENFSPNCKKFGEYLPSVQIAKERSTEADIVLFWGGGRADMTCPFTEIQVDYYQPNMCYCETAPQYDIWWWLMIILFCADTVWTLWCFYVMRAGEPGKKVPLNPQFIAIFMNLAACIIRIVWLFNCYDGRGQAAGEVFSETVNSFFTKISQVFMLCEFLLMVLVWKAIVDSTQKMKAMNKDAQKAADHAKYRNTGLMILFMIVTICPLDIIGANGKKLFGTLSNLLLLVITLVLIGGGVVYSRTLAKLLSGNDASKMDKKKKDAINSILASVYASTFLAFVCLLVVVINIVLAPYGTLYLVWGWWLPIHGCECCLLFVLANSTSQKARAARNAGKTTASLFAAASAGASVSENQTSTVSERSEKIKVAPAK